MVVGLILTAITSPVLRVPLMLIGSIGTLISLVLLIPILIRLRAIWYDTQEGCVEELAVRLEQRSKPVLVDARGRHLQIGRRLTAALRGKAPSAYTAYVCQHTRRVVGLVPAS